MTISKETIELRKQSLAQDFSTLKGRIDTAEKEIVGMRNNLNAVAGAIQQCDMFLKQLADDTDAPMSAEKQQALDIATS